MSICNDCNGCKEKNVNYVNPRCVKCRSVFEVCISCFFSTTTHLFNVKNTCKQCLRILNRSERIDDILQ